MLSNFCIDLAVQYVKTIVDFNRCGLCDKLDGARMRFACGHSACVDCVATLATECPTCSPLTDPSSNTLRSDEPLTERVKHASELLTSFEDAFDVNVYLRQRISERLKIEKELFPECIQAPSQYFNKRKSLNVSHENKENTTTIFPGEEISLSREMNKSKNYVQQWLNKQSNISKSPQSRTPFSDLKVNTHHKQATLHSIASKQKENASNLPTQPSSRKRSRIKQTPSTSTTQSNLESYLKPVGKGESKKAWMSAKRLKQDLDTNPAVCAVQGKNNCDESGIVIDDDCFTIEDTRDQVIDKDRLALLAVANADSQASESVVVIEDSLDQNNPMYNEVPFYRKSYLFKNCSQCIGNDEVNVVEPNMHENDSGRFSDISITVENKCFITTINVVDCKPVKKQSTTVQTDLREPFLGFEQPEQKEEAAQLISQIQEYIQNEAMFEEAKGTDLDSQKTTCTDVVLEKNDDEINVGQGDNKMMVDQNSEHDYGILTELRAGLQNRRRKAARGATPDSNNSSDKENYDPNRRKKNDGKKKTKKENK